MEIEINPFILEHKLRLVEVHKKEEYIPKDAIQDNIILETTQFVHKYTIEEQQSCSLYRMGGLTNILFKELSSSGRDLILYIMVKLPKHQDFIILDYQTVHKNIGMSKQSFYNSVKELMDIAMLRKAKVKTYWVNPLYIYNGNRKILYRKSAPEQIKINHTIYK